MKNLFRFALTFALLATPAHASMRVFDSSSTQIGIFTDLQLGNGLGVSQVSGKAKVVQASGDGTVPIAGFLHTQLSVTGSLTAANCGATVTSNVAGGSTPLYTLPAITSALLGCRYTFIVGTATGSAHLTIAPNAANKILVLNTTAGHSVSNNVLGNSVTIEAISPGWAPVGKEQGTWFAN